MPKTSSAALAVVSPTRLLLRLKPPSDLSAAERRHWLLVVDNLPGGFFTPEQTSLLRIYVRHLATADRLDAALAELDVLDGRWPRLSAAAVSHSKAALAAARALRIPLSARTHKATAATAAGSRKTPTLESLRAMYADEKLE